MIGKVRVGPRHTSWWLGSLLYLLCRAGYFTPMLVFYFLAPPACWIARRTWHYSSTVPDNCTPAGCGSGTFAAAFHSLLCSREGPSVHCHVFNVMTAAFGHTRHFSRLDDSVLVFPCFGVGAGLRFAPLLGGGGFPATSVSAWVPPARILGG